jgi:hypothetical protein
MKTCDNADSDNRAAATNSTSLNIFLIRVQFSFCSVEVKLLENGLSKLRDHCRYIAVDAFLTSVGGKSPMRVSRDAYLETWFVLNAAI